MESLSRTSAYLTAINFIRNVYSEQFGEHKNVDKNRSNETNKTIFMLNSAEY